MNWKSILKTVLKFSVSGVLIYWVLQGIDLDEAWGYVREARLFYVFLGTIFFALSKAMSSVRLNRFFRAIDVRLTESTNLRLYILGMFYNLFLPGGIGGDGYKVYWLKKHGQGEVKKLVWATLIDRISGMLALLMLGMLFFLFTGNLSHPSASDMAALPSVIQSTLEVVYVVLQFLSELPILVIVLIPLVYIIYYLAVGRLYPYFKNDLLFTTLQSFVVQGLQLLAIFAIAKALDFQWNDPVLYFLFLISSVVAILPISVGGLGLREFVFLSGAILYNMEESHAVSVSALFYLITVFVSLFGSYYQVRNEQIAKSLERHIEVD